MKYLKWMALFLAIILLIGAPTAFADEYDDDDYECSHDYVRSGEKKPTCTEWGRRYWICSICGDHTSKRNGKPLGHNWGEWTIITEPTCSAPGLGEHKCKRCGKIAKEKIDPLPHTFDNWVVLEEPTDHSSGIRRHICRVCGFEETETYDPEGTLRRNDEGENVKEFQSMLFCRGFLKKGNINGKFNSTTEKAVKKCQEAEGLTVDGIAWPQTIARLGHQYGEWQVSSVKSDFSKGYKERTCAICGYTTCVEEYPSPMLKRKDKGDNVSALQQALNDAGYNCGRVDGDFGGATERAIKAFEKDRGLEEDGIAWPGIIKLLGLNFNSTDVPLVLTVTRVSPSEENPDENGKITVEWTLVNQGNVDCSYWRIDYGTDLSAESSQFMVSGSLPLKAASANARTRKCEITIPSDTELSAITFKANGIGSDGARYESEEATLQ